MRGFVFRSETQAEKESGNVKGTGLVNIGNDRSITYVDASTAVHTSFNGFLDHIFSSVKFIFTAFLYLV